VSAQPVHYADQPAAITRDPDGIASALSGARRMAFYQELGHVRTGEAFERLLDGWWCRATSDSRPTARHACGQPAREPCRRPPGTRSPAAAPPREIAQTTATSPTNAPATAHTNRDSNGVSFPMLDNWLPASNAAPTAAELPMSHFAALRILSLALRNAVKSGGAGVGGGGIGGGGEGVAISCYPSALMGRST
jgi:hypothetical protein